MRAAQALAGAETASVARWAQTPRCATAPILHSGDRSIHSHVCPAAYSTRARVRVGALLASRFERLRRRSANAGGAKLNRKLGGAAIESRQTAKFQPRESSPLWAYERVRRPLIEDASTDDKERTNPTNLPGPANTLQILTLLPGC